MVILSRVGGLIGVTVPVRTPELPARPMVVLATGNDTAVTDAVAVRVGGVVAADGDETTPKVNGDDDVIGGILPKLRTDGVVA